MNISRIIWSVSVIYEGKKINGKQFVIHHCEDKYECNSETEALTQHERWAMELALIRSPYQRARRVWRWAGGWCRWRSVLLEPELWAETRPGNRTSCPDRWQTHRNRTAVLPSFISQPLNIIKPTQWPWWEFRVTLAGFCWYQIKLKPILWHKKNCSVEQKQPSETQPLLFVVVHRPVDFLWVSTVSESFNLKNK